MIKDLDFYYVLLIFIAWVIPLKDKKGTTITNAFQKRLRKSNRKPNKIWVSKSSKFCNRSIKSFLQNTYIKMYSTHNEEKSVIAEGFVRTLKNKIYKYPTSISKNVFLDKLDDIVNKYNNTYHKTIEMKPFDVKSNTYIDSTKEVTGKDPKFKICDIVRISKYKIIFTKVKNSLQLDQKKLFWLIKINNSFMGIYY